MVLVQHTKTDIPVFIIALQNISKGNTVLLSRISEYEGEAVGLVMER